jgi:hypothetical protein
MLLVFGALVGLVAGLATGGSIHNLLALRLRWPLVVIAAFLVRELEIRSGLATSSLAPAVFVASLLALIAWAVWHRDRLHGIWLVVVGMMLNLAVVLANGGRMPVVESAAYLGPPQLRQRGVWAEYALMGRGTRMDWLGDWIVLPQPVGRLLPQAYSPGDLVSLVGLAAILFLATRPPATAPQEAITTR